MGEFTREDKLTLPAAKKRGLRNRLTKDWRTKDWDTVAQMYECADKMADQLDDLRERNRKLYEALQDTLPIIKRYGWTQGDNEEYHANLVGPFQTAVDEERAHREREASDD